MNFTQTINTIHRWIDSCTSADQIGLIRDVVDRFVRDRYKHHIDPAEYNRAEQELAISLMDKEYSFQQHKCAEEGVDRDFAH